MRKRPVMLSERMEGLQVPLIALAVWAVALATVGCLLGNLLIGLVIGGAVGAYAAFGRSPLAAVLKWPAVVAVYGLVIVGALN